MTIATRYSNGNFEVLKDGNVIVSQPFKPTSTGEQLPWANEAEAVAWWNASKDLIAGAPETPPSA